MTASCHNNNKQQQQRKHLVLLLFVLVFVRLHVSSDRAICETGPCAVSAAFDETVTYTSAHTHTLTQKKESSQTKTEAAKSLFQK